MENISTNGLEIKQTHDNATKTLVNGYDLPVYGLNNGQFYVIHVPAIACIIASFLSALAVTISSFRLQSFRTFFMWTKSERFVVYLAVCDGLFNLSHSLDHLHIVITRDHVYPKQLCQFYGFMLAEFVTAQNLMVNIVALNVFVLLYFRKDINFGMYDWRVLVYTFGLPCVGALIAAYFDKLGPNGTFCYFDGVKGVIANLLFTTVPLLTVLTLNILLYVLTWSRIKKEVKQLQYTLGKKVSTVRASHQAARTMSLFVVAFFAQWWAMALYGIWQIIAPVPQELFQFVTTFSNIGGILNGVVYVIIKRRKRRSSLRLKPKTVYTINN